VHTHDEIEQRLIAILAMVNDWLKFAETKNAAVVGLGSAGVAVLASIISGQDDTLLQVGLALAVVLVAGSVLVGLGSFFPRTSLARHLTREVGKPAANDNLYYYGHLAKYEPASLVETIAREYIQVDITDEVYPRSRHDLAAQIIVNSRIALDKLHLFAISTALFAFGLIVALLAVLIAIVV
jgi:hypothetical protein